MTTINNKNEKRITEARASVCLLLATALDCSRDMRFLEYVNDNSCNILVIHLMLFGNACKYTAVYKKQLATTDHDSTRLDAFTDCLIKVNDYSVDH